MQTLKRLEPYFVVLAMILFAGAANHLFKPPGEIDVDGVASDARLQVVWFGLYAIAALFFAVNWRRVASWLWQDKWMIALLSVVGLSYFWSAAPDITVRRLVAIAGTTLFAYYVAARFSVRQTLQFMAWALGLSAIASVALALGYPAWGIEQGAHHAGAWQGVFVQKNTLGRFMVVAMMAFSVLAIVMPQRRGWMLLGFVGTAGVLAMSTSATAFLLAAVVVGLVLVLPLMRLQATLALPVAAALLLLGIVGAAVGSAFGLDVLDYLGRDVTLTGRTDIWEACWNKMAEHPTLGYGYGGFWLGWDGASAYVWRVTGWEAPFAHNGFIDLALDLGYVGLSVFVMHFLTTGVACLRALRRHPDPAVVWLPVFMAYLLVLNLTESSFLRQNNFLWIMYVVAALQARAALRAPAIAEATEEDEEAEGLVPQPLAS